MNTPYETYPNISYWVVEMQEDVEIGWDEETHSLVRAFQFGELIWQSGKDMKSLDQALKELEGYITDFVDPNPYYWGDEYGYEPKD
ncbi:MAG: hypothetical protein V7K76_14405 [Nostoc sp.]|uniref:hypothetical protein n=1 Tax=Nostoc sp. TaxID=1180 RepID=UPI002FFACBC0